MGGKKQMNKKNNKTISTIISIIILIIVAIFGGDNVLNTFIAESHFKNKYTR